MGYRFLIVGLKVRVDAILVLSSDKEEKRSSHKGLSASLTKGAQKIGVL